MNDSDKGKFSDGLAALSVAFDKPIDQAMRSVYWQFLRDLALCDFLAAVDVAGRTLKWFPRPAELRELAEGPRKITAAMQWAHVRRMLDKLDIYGSPDFGPVVNAVIHALGGWKVLCEKSIPDLVWIQKDFERLYTEYNTKDLSGLRTEGHVGQFGKPPEWCALEGTPRPPAQLESAEKHQVNGIVRELADSKSNTSKEQQG